MVYLIIGEGGKLGLSVEEGNEVEEGWEGLWCHVRGMRLGGTFFCAVELKTMNTQLGFIHRTANEDDNLEIENSCIFEFSIPVYVSLS